MEQHFTTAGSWTTGFQKRRSTLDEALPVPNTAEGFRFWEIKAEVNPDDLLEKLALLEEKKVKWVHTLLDLLTI